VADYLRADCLAVYVATHSDLSGLTAAERETLDRHLNFARGLRIDTRVLEGSDTARAIIDFARFHGVTQIFVARERTSGVRAWFAAAFVQRIVSLAKDMQVTVVADRSVRREPA
jgi:two-component system sensor histidine kinase KdpD